MFLSFSKKIGDLTFGITLVQDKNVFLIHHLKNGRSPYNYAQSSKCSVYAFS